MAGDKHCFDFTLNPEDAEAFEIYITHLGIRYRLLKEISDSAVPTAGENSTFINDPIFEGDVNDVTGSSILKTKTIEGKEYQNVVTDDDLFAEDSPKRIRIIIPEYPDNIIFQAVGVACRSTLTFPVLSINPEVNFIADFTGSLGGESPVELGNDFEVGTGSFEETPKFLTFTATETGSEDRKRVLYESKNIDSEDLFLHGNAEWVTVSLNSGFFPEDFPGAFYVNGNRRAYYVDISVERNDSLGPRTDVITIGGQSNRGISQISFSITQEGREPDPPKIDIDTPAELAFDADRVTVRFRVQNLLPDASSNQFNPLSLDFRVASGSMIASGSILDTGSNEGNPVELQNPTAILPPISTGSGTIPIEYSGSVIFRVNRFEESGSRTQKLWAVSGSASIDAIDTGSASEIKITQNGGSAPTFKFVTVNPTIPDDTANEDNFYHISFVVTGVTFGEFARYAPDEPRARADNAILDTDYISFSVSGDNIIIPIGDASGNFNTLKDIQSNIQENTLGTATDNGTGTGRGTFGFFYKANTTNEQKTQVITAQAYNSFGFSAQVSITITQLAFTPHAEFQRDDFHISGSLREKPAGGDKLPFSQNLLSNVIKNSVDALNVSVGYDDFSVYVTNDENKNDFTGTAPLPISQKLVNDLQLFKLISGIELNFDITGSIPTQENRENGFTYSTGSVTSGSVKHITGSNSGSGNFNDLSTYRLNNYEFRSLSGSQYYAGNGSGSFNFYAETRGDPNSVAYKNFLKSISELPIVIDTDEDLSVSYTDNIPRTITFDLSSIMIPVILPTVTPTPPFSEDTGDGAKFLSAAPPLTPTPTVSSFPEPTTTPFVSPMPTQLPTLILRVTRQRVSERGNTFRLFVTLTDAVPSNIEVVIPDFANNYIAVREKSSQSLPPNNASILFYIDTNTTFERRDATMLIRVRNNVGVSSYSTFHIEQDPTTILARSYLYPRQLSYNDIQDSVDLRIYFWSTTNFGLVTASDITGVNMGTVRGVNITIRSRGSYGRRFNGWDGYVYLRITKNSSPFSSGTVSLQFSNRLEDPNDQARFTISERFPRQVVNPGTQTVNLNDLEIPTDFSGLFVGTDVYNNERKYAYDDNISVNNINSLAGLQNRNNSLGWYLNRVITADTFQNSYRIVKTSNTVIPGSFQIEIDTDGYDTVTFTVNVVNNTGSGATQGDQGSLPRPPDYDPPPADRDRRGLPQGGPTIDTSTGTLQLRVLGFYPEFNIREQDLFITPHASNEVGGRTDKIKLIQYGPQPIIRNLEYRQTTPHPFKGDHRTFDGDLIRYFPESSEQSPYWIPARDENNRSGPTVHFSRNQDDNIVTVSFNYRHFKASDIKLLEQPSWIAGERSIRVWPDAEIPQDREETLKERREREDYKQRIDPIHLNTNVYFCNRKLIIEFVRETLQQHRDRIEDQTVQGRHHQLGRVRLGVNTPATPTPAHTSSAGYVYEFWLEAPADSSSVRISPSPHREETGPTITVTSPSYFTGSNKERSYPINGYQESIIFTLTNSTVNRTFWSNFNRPDWITGFRVSSLGGSSTQGIANFEVLSTLPTTHDRVATLTLITRNNENRDAEEEFIIRIPGEHRPATVLPSAFPLSILPTPPPSPAPIPSCHITVNPNTFNIDENAHTLSVTLSGSNVPTSNPFSIRRGHPSWIIPGEVSGITSGMEAYGEATRTLELRIPGTTSRRTGTITIEGINRAGISCSAVITINQVITVPSIYVFPTRRTVDWTGQQAASFNYILTNIAINAVRFDSLNTERIVIGPNNPVILEDRNIFRLRPNTWNTFLNEEEQKGPSSRQGTVAVEVVNSAGTRRQTVTVIQLKRPGYQNPPTIRFIFTPPAGLMPVATTIAQNVLVIGNIDTVRRQNTATSPLTLQIGFNLQNALDLDVKIDEDSSENLDRLTISPIQRNLSSEGSFSIIVPSGGDNLDFPIKIALVVTTFNLAGEKKENRDLTNVEIADLNRQDGISVSGPIKTGTIIILR